MSAENRYATPLKPNARSSPKRSIKMPAPPAPKIPIRPYFLLIASNTSIGTGKMMVEFFSVAISVRV